jgi:hypothetical protein
LHARKEEAGPRVKPGVTVVENVRLRETESSAPTTENLSRSAKGLSYTGRFPLVTTPAFYVERRRLFALSINMKNAPPFVAS